jgi:hypothetical protein
LPLFGFLAFVGSRYYHVWSIVVIGLALGLFGVSIAYVARPLRPLPSPQPLRPPPPPVPHR